MSLTHASLYGKLSAAAVVVVSDTEISCDLSDEVAILDLETGAYFGLDSVGGRIWALLRKPRKVAEICDILLDEYEVDRGTCERDLIDLLAKLAARGLVKIDE